MELETVLYRVEGNVGIVSLNRTKALNAMSKQIFVDLTTPSTQPRRTTLSAAWWSTLRAALSAPAATSPR